MKRARDNSYLVWEMTVISAIFQYFVRDFPDVGLDRYASENLCRSGRAVYPRRRMVYVLDIFAANTVSGRRARRT